MVQNVEITCINKDDRYDPFERIRAIGGVNSDGTRWRLPLQDAINGIEDGKWTFYVSRPEGDTVWVEIAVSRAGNQYLKTEADGDRPNNLLSLPECPRS